MLKPYPFEALVSRIFRECERDQAVFGLPLRKALQSHPRMDLSISYFGRRATSPLGPAAGPHTQMAQNIVLAWLAGAGILELKTIQVMDRLELSRPCIDMRTVGFNTEWSQELSLDESLDEYIKGYMLIEMLRQSAPWSQDPNRGPVLYDLSVGYDLAGISGGKVRNFIDGMLNTKTRADYFRRSIPAEFRHHAELDVPDRLADSVTLSTFHGCPPDEIESIIDFLFREYRLNCVIKFNPTLLGKRETRELINNQLGYERIIIRDEAFDDDLSWDRAINLVERLGRTADELGLQLGVKFTNTLIVKNTGTSLPESEETAYLSGPPLHPLAMRLISRFRKIFRDRFPISLSAGIDRKNFPDAVALGLKPITACTDLLKPGGYSRFPLYYGELYRRMEAVGATTVDEFKKKAYAPEGSSGDVSANTEYYLKQVAADSRYSHTRNNKPPRKIQRKLELFDCLTCDICLAVCPNNALFAFADGETEVPSAGIGSLAEKHQIGLFGDFCNQCGNCDVFCPEDGGPQFMKPAFYGSETSWRESRHASAFYLAGGSATTTVLGRIAGREYRLEKTGDRVSFSGTGFNIRFQASHPQGTISGNVPEKLDLRPYFIMDFFRRVLLETGRINYINTLVHIKESKDGL
ncbi:MAG: glutamate synthase [Candidatus Eisenbacteria bacterium]|nr:glutamate synthase [Candidatus Eisenbacteria bacterium]MBU1947339.1 glutamate synthase [Candidatus Eisenbacteria bacterium]